VNTILLEPEEIVAGRALLTDERRVRHVRTVHRAAVGDELRVGVVGGRLGTAVVSAGDRDRLALDVTLAHQPPAPLPITLILALPRPKVVRRVLQGVAALGVKRCILVAAWRVERSYWESPRLTAAAVRADLVLGLEQAGDTVLPAVELRRRFKPFVEDEIASVAGASRRLVAHPAAAAACPRAVATAVTLAVGPEGGFTDYEVDLLAAHGFEAVSMGSRVLRVEQAVPALLGRLF